jgi:hypothetical protein
MNECKNTIFRDKNESHFQQSKCTDDRFNTRKNYRHTYIM